MANFERTKGGKISFSDIISDLSLKISEEELLKELLKEDIIMDNILEHKGNHYLLGYKLKLEEDDNKSISSVLTQAMIGDEVKTHIERAFIKHKPKYETVSKEDLTKILSEQHDKILNSQSELLTDHHNKLKTHNDKTTNIQHTLDKLERENQMLRDTASGLELANNNLIKSHKTEMESMRTSYLNSLKKVEESNKKNESTIVTFKDKITKQNNIILKLKEELLERNTEIEQFKSIEHQQQSHHHYEEPHQQRSWSFF